jgi:hypothetical protein
MSGIAPKQNAFKLRIAPQKKSIVKEKVGREVPPPANGTLFLSTPKHNSKSSTGQLNLISNVISSVFLT